MRLHNWFHPDMSTVNKNIAVEAKLISPPTYLTRYREHFPAAGLLRQPSCVGCVADLGYFPLDYYSTNTADTDTPTLSLHDVDGLRVRNSRHSTSSETLCVWKICS